MERQESKCLQAGWNTFFNVSYSNRTALNMMIWMHLVSYIMTGIKQPPNLMHNPQWHI